ncbi:MAG TPA: HD domain-containing protein [Jatrophihabitantaceae bacterium]|jgi:HD superfamily phosphodiesterase
MGLVDDARSLTEQELALTLPRRWVHVQAVAERAASLASVPNFDREALTAAAWLHDIGYAPPLVDTGFHPLDGARHLRRLGTVPERVVGLVAHHSCAVIEADERGLLDELVTEFDREESPTADALWYADMTTGPDGQHIPVDERLAEIRARYGPGHIVTRFINRAEPQIVAAVERTKSRLASARTDGSS